MVNVEDVQLTFAMCSPKLHQNWDQSLSLYLITQNLETVL